MDGSICLYIDPPQKNLVIIENAHIVLLFPGYPDT